MAVIQTNDNGRNKDLWIIHINLGF